MKVLKYSGLLLFLFGIWSYYSLGQHQPSQASYEYLLGYYMPAAIPLILGGMLYFGIRRFQKEEKKKSGNDK